MNGDRTRAIRKAIIEALPADTSLHGQTPERRHVYVPPSHAKALRLECGLVIGARGVGKTFWSAALKDDRIRNMLGQSVRDLPNLEVRIGYSEVTNPFAYPGADTFQQLLKNSCDPYTVWRGVIARWLAEVVSEAVPSDDWPETTEWVRRNPESLERLMETANTRFQSADQHGLIVFDALDRTSHDWQTMDRIVRDLLRIVLGLKPFQRLHGKVFLREDQYHGRTVTNFPDASKIEATRVELTWAPHELHGLLWQYLCNAPNEHGKVLREVYKEVVKSSPLEEIDDVWTLPDGVKRDESEQRSLFVALAGEWMGRDRRRGIPYTWTVGHLADGRGRTSPRSFLAAIRAAAEDSADRYREHASPLHYESIKRGVQKASDIRVSELAEDYPWARDFMEPLSGLTVPCPAETIEGRWRGRFADNPMEIKISFERLPPEHQEEGWKGIRRDLVDLGIFEEMRDGRINMPDLYRVGFGLGRRGGVKPVTKAATA